MRCMSSIYTRTLRATLTLALQDHQNLVAIVAIEKDIPVQQAISYVTLMVQAAFDRYSEARAQFPSFGSETDDEVAKYICGMERVCT